jgi:hypothetical protein
MKPCSDVEYDLVQDTKTYLGRWASNGSFQEYDLQIKLWCALEAHGFTAIRLWIEPYERPHRLWRFSVQCATKTSCLVVERGVKSACEKAGFMVEKGFVAAVVPGKRARGGFVLPDASQVPLS